MKRFLTTIAASFVDMSPDFMRDGVKKVGVGISMEAAMAGAKIAQMAAMSKKRLNCMLI